jgi:hypothetical protein
MAHKQDPRDIIIAELQAGGMSCAGFAGGYLV